jgi:tetratricopeptide (TPR) repeat protein
VLTDRYEEAISFFSEHITRYPQDWAALRGRAAALWYAGKLQEATADYSRVLEMTPNDILSLSGRGQVLAELAQSEKALEDLDLALEAIKEAPESGPNWAKWYEQIEAFIRNGRALALAGLGEHSTAMREFDSSITLSPNNAWVYYNRASVLEAAGNRQKASLDYQMALTKEGPALNPIRRERAQARLREMLI